MNCGSRIESGSKPRQRAGRRVLAAAALMLVWAGSVPARGQETEPPKPEAAAQKPNPDSPRGAVLAYLVASRAGDYERAADYLNLSPVPASTRARRGPQLAKELKIVLDRELWVDVGALSNAPGGDPQDGLGSGRDRIGVIQTESGPVDVLVERVGAPGGRRAWKISGSTVAQVPELYEEFGYGALGKLLPSLFFEVRLLEVELWQWIGVLVFILVAYVGSWFAVRFALRVIASLTARTRTTIDDRLAKLVGAPGRLLVGVIFFHLGGLSLGLAVPARRLFGNLETALVIVAVTWLMLRLVDLLGALMEERLVQRGQGAATTFVPAGRKVVKPILVALALLVALDLYGYDVTAVIAGLGIGGLAVALAAQKTLENLFGGMTLIADRPLQVGDFCRFGDRVGTVEEIGLRSTRVRTLDRTVVAVPNAEFSSMQLENFAVREKFWFHPTIGLRYETTPDQLRYVLVEIRRMLYAHPKVDPDPARVRFESYGDFSLNLGIFAYVLGADWNEFLEVSEDLNLRIMDIVNESGTGFAFPSHTSYLAKDDGVDPEKTRAAEAKVRAWREKDELCLPRFPEAEIAALDSSLDYPEKGSAVARS